MKRKIEHDKNHYDIEEKIVGKNGVECWAVVECSYYKIKKQSSVNYVARTMVPVLSEEEKKERKRKTSRDAVKRHYERNREKILKRQKKNIYKKYGMTQSDYDKMLDEQNGVCFLCGRPPKDGKRLVVDHSHETGRVRGLLCTTCNVGLGLLQDNSDLLKKAADYI